MFRNTDLFDVLVGPQEYFHEDSPLFDFFNSDLSSPTLTNFDEIENSNNSKSQNLLDEDDPIILLEKNPSLDHGAFSNNDYGMDEENQINPPIIGTFSTHQAQPQFIDIEEESSNESQGSNQTKDTRNQ